MWQKQLQLDFVFTHLRHRTAVSPARFCYSHYLRAHKGQYIHSLGWERRNGFFKRTGIERTFLSAGNKIGTSRIKYSSHTALRYELCQLWNRSFHSVLNVQLNRWHSIKYIYQSWTFLCQTFHTGKSSAATIHAWVCWLLILITDICKSWPPRFGTDGRIGHPVEKNEHVCTTHLRNLVNKTYSYGLIVL